MPLFGLIPRVVDNQQELKSAAGPIIRIVCLSFMQVVAMAAATIFFFEYKGLAGAFYDRFYWFAGYIPFLRRYGDYFAQLNRLEEFKEIFSIYSGYFVLETVFVFGIAALLFKHVDLRTPNLHGSWRSFLLLVFPLIIFISFLFGDVVIKMSSLATGNYSRGLIAYCLTLPGSNFILSLVIYSNFGKPMSGALRRIGSGSEQN